MTAIEHHVRCEVDEEEIAILHFVLCESIGKTMAHMLLLLPRIQFRTRPNALHTTGHTLRIYAIHNFGPK